MIYITQPMVTRMSDGDHAIQACLKIVTSKGELSIACDNSCGALKNLSRVSAQVFYLDGGESQEKFGFTVEELYIELGKLLGK